MEEDFKKQNSTATDQVNADLRRMGVLKFDEMKIKEKFVERGRFLKNYYL